MQSSTTTTDSDSDGDGGFAPAEAAHNGRQPRWNYLRYNQFDGVRQQSRSVHGKDSLEAGRFGRYPTRLRQSRGGSSTPSLTTNCSDSFDITGDSIEFNLARKSLDFALWRSFLEPALGGHLQSQHKQLLCQLRSDEANPRRPSLVAFQC